MKRHPNRPLISLFVLAAVVGAALARPTPTTQAQATTYPGQSDPIGTRAGALTQFPDDELITLNDADSADYQLVGYVPNADYTLPPAVDAHVLDYRPTGQVPFADGGYQIQNETASGRVVVPTRDVALTLSKTAVDTTSQTITWVLQEMSFDTPGSDLPKTVPTRTWTSQVQNSSYFTDSPGALAIADVDRTLTPDATYGATYNDEALVAYEVQDSTGSTSHLQLDVVNYVARTGQATVVASASTTATNTGTFAYLCNLSSIAAGGCSPHPGNIKVTTGDMDGDGFEDIVLLATMYQAQDDAMVLQSYLYSYCPAALASSDARVAAGICSAGAQSATLAAPRDRGGEYCR